MYQEALEDGIRISYDKNGCTWYHPVCHVCGETISSMRYRRGDTYTCFDCKKLLAETQRKADDRTVKCKKLETAIKRISKVADIDEYTNAIQRMRDIINHKGWFQSTEEIMVGLELIRHKVRAFHQVSVYEYRVDFVLPEYKTVLEIDGPIFHGKERRARQEIRDEVITRKFGEGWEIIHISTECINKNITRLLPAIREVLRRRKCAH